MLEYVVRKALYSSVPLKKGACFVFFIENVFWGGGAGWKGNVRAAGGLKSTSLRKKGNKHLFKILLMTRGLGS